MNNDEGCPTCGSKDFANLEIQKTDEGKIIWKNHCYNCKKFWNTEF